MNIKGIGTQNNINIYGINARNNIQSVDKVKETDSIEISGIGKALNSYDASEISVDNTAKIERIKEQLANGTYNVDSKLTAQSIINAINEGKNIDDK